MAENPLLEKKIPALTVLKNSTILKNIFILDAQPPPLQEDSGGDNVHEFEETLWIGRHPDCNIILEHPSISRFHLRIDSKPYSLSFSVTDLSSVHGTWVCGNKIEPNARVYLNEGDTIRLGGSSRIYRLHWVPMSIAYDLEHPFLPPMDLSDHPVDEKEQTLDASKDLDYLLPGMKTISSLEELIPSAPPMPTENTFYVAEGVENNGGSGNGLEHDETSKLQLFNETAQESNENDAPGTLSVADEFRMVSLLENPDASPLRSAQKNALSIRARRGVCASVQVFTCKSKENRSSACAESEGNLTDDDLDSPDTSPLRSAQKTSLSIRSRRGVCASVQKSKENRSSAESEGYSIDDDDGTEIESISRNLFPCENDDDKTYDSGILSVADQYQRVAPVENLEITPIRSAQTDALGIWCSRGKCARVQIISSGVKESCQSLNSENSTDHDDDTATGSILKNLFNCTDDTGNSENNGTPGMLSVVDQSQTDSTLENPETPPGRSTHKNSLNIWSRRGKSASIQIITGRTKEKWVGADTQVNSTDHDNSAVDSIPKDLCPWSPNDVEEIFTPNKENLTFDYPLIRSLKKTDQGSMKNELILTSWKSFSYEDEDGNEHHDNSAVDSMPKDLCPWSPNDVAEIFTPDKENLTFDYPLIRSLKKTDQDSMKNESILTSWKSFSDEDGDEIYTPDKENITPDSLRSKFMKKITNMEILGGKNLCRSSPLKNMIGSNIHRENQDSTLFDNENQALKSVPKYVDSSAEEYEDEIFTPDKENITPDTLQSKSIKKMRKLEEIRDNNSLRSSLLKNMTSSNRHGGESHVLTAFSNKNQVPVELLEQKYWSSTSRVRSKLTLQPISPKGEEDGVPYQSLRVEPTTSTTQMKDQGHADSVKTKSKETMSRPLTQPVRKNATRVENTARWIMVVDTASLLKNESRQALTLLQGLKKTNLVVPSIVVQELEGIKRCGGFFERTNEASSALQWIEDCMVNAKCWIHVQCHEEEAKRAATTPATPLSCFGGENRMFSDNWFSQLGALLNPIPFPTLDNHILECALFVRKSMNGRVVLLSDDDTLKVKAMAEGLLCESAEQFREGLVNPFSESFLWTDSSPRGLTWSCMDDVILREKFYRGRLKSLSESNEVAMGLKLVLPHNSQYRNKTQIIPKKMLLLKLILLL